ncbi:MAG: hypothetical protein ABIJ47_05565 [Candidatus Bathyarchaeota archaeon]
MSGGKYRVTSVNGEIKLTPITQTEVLAGLSLAAAVSKAMVNNVEVSMLVVARR